MAHLNTLDNIDTEHVTAIEPLLDIRGLRKVYGGTAALSDVDMVVGRGEIHALLGENGAGKSTLVKILAAVAHEDAGSIILNGQPLPNRRTPRTMSDLGVAFIHQDLGLVGSMTVAENIAQYAGYPLGWRGIDWRETRVRARRALAKLDVDLDPDVPVAELSIAEQAAVAIVRALALDARLIVLDEPTASLAAVEAKRLFASLVRLREAGISCIVVTHRIDEVLEHCDRVTVLRNGSLIGTRAVADLDQDTLVEMIVGEVPELARRSVPASSASTAATAAGATTLSRLQVRELCGPGFGPIDFEVAAGEIVAVTGFADAGHLRLVGALFGAQPVTGGIVRVDEREYRPSSPAHALDCGLHQVPADRAAEGLAMGMTARENLFPNPSGPAMRPVSGRVERQRAHELMTGFDVRPRDCEAEVSTFSGGNAQKLLVARALATEPRLLLLSEPTAGVDVGARALIYRKLREACADGLSIVIASSDFQEVVDVADRAVVMSRGSVTAELPASELSVASLTGASYGT
jgi:ribose transport system ATP-binding protein